MSFKQFSSQQDAPSKDKDKPKVAPATDLLTAQPDNTPEEVGPPAPKS